MSQKTNPTLLRLKKTNKDFSYSWYSDHFYGQYNNYSLLLHKYIKQINAQIGSTQALIFFDMHYKRCFAYLFLLDARGLREKRGSDMRLPWLQVRSQKQESKALANNPQYKLEHSLLRSKSKIALKENLEEETTGSRSQNMCIAANSSSTSYVCATGTREATQEESLDKREKSVLWAKILRDNLLEFTLQPNVKKETTNNHTCLSYFVLASFKQSARKPTAYSHSFTTTKRLASALTGQNKLLPRLDTCNRSALAFVKKSKDDYAQTHLRSKCVEHARAQREFTFKDTSSLVSSTQASKSADGTALLLLRASERSSSKPESSSSTVSAFSYHKRSLYNIEESIRVQPWWFSTLCPIRVIEDVQSAHFLASEIVYLLERRVNFKRIKDQILREIIKKNQIKGIRLSCSGRVASRSKKAQKTKTQFLQWGDTSLHVFSSKLSFSCKSAYTPFGTVGVKVWLCYK